VSNTGGVMEGKLHFAFAPIFKAKPMRPIAPLLIGLVTGLLLVPASAAKAQTAAPKPTQVRKALGSAPLASAVDVPLYFKLVRGTLEPGASVTFSTEDGFVYVSAGELKVEGAQQASLGKGEALYVARQAAVVFRAGGAGPAGFLHFILQREADLRSGSGANAKGLHVLHQSAAPIPGLQAGPHEFLLFQNTFMPHTPANPPHRRSGAALYYVLSGQGEIRFEGKTELRSTGAIQYEPNTFVHQWGNPNDTPMVLVRMNISREGAPFVIFESAPK
jgi:quercetin dioxygenase-like cupin family protein